MTEYPRDRFDDVPEYTDRKGGHRAHFDPPVETTGLRWIAVTAAFALAVGAFCFFILPGLLSSAPATSGATAESAPSASQQSATPPAEASSTASTSATPTAPADASTVEVYAVADTGGTAEATGEQLRSAGFTVGGAGAWQGFAVPQSAVYYSAGEDTAEAVAAQLELPTVYDGRVPGVVVVLTGTP